MEGRRNTICIEVATCRGHPNVQLTHESTLEFSPETFLGVRGDCILCIELGSRVLLPGNCSTGLSKVRVLLEIIVVPPPWIGLGAQKFSIICNGICDLNGIVLRKSTYCDKRTLAISCDKSAFEIRMLSPLKEIAADPFTKIYVRVKL